MQTLSKAGELSLKLPREVVAERLAKLGGKSTRTLPVNASKPPPHVERVTSRALSIVARNDSGSGTFVEQFMQEHCRTGVSDEWKLPDDAKLDKLRGILAALKEENQCTQLLKRESADREAGRELEKTRANFRTRLRACSEQEKAFEQKEGKLKEHILKNEKDLKLMENNIEKGDRKARDEALECKRLDSEIRTADQAIEELKVGKESEEAQISKASAHKAFLERVVLDKECEADFEGDIKVLMNRYFTLDAEKQSLHQHNAALAVQLNRVREESSKIQTEIQTKQMISSSRLHESQVALERLKAENKELEENLNRMINEKELRKSQAGVTRMAIEQIFARIVQSCRLKQRKEAMLADVEDRNKKFAPVRGGTKADPRLEAMLNQIIARVKDLKDMSEVIRDQLERHKKPQVALDEEGDILQKVQIIVGRSGDPLDVLDGISSHQSSDLVSSKLCRA